MFKIGQKVKFKPFSFGGYTNSRILDNKVYTISYIGRNMSQQANKCPYNGVELLELEGREFCHNNFKPVKSIDELINKCK